MIRFRINSENNINIFKKNALNVLINSYNTLNYADPYIEMYGLSKSKLNLFDQLQYAK